MKFFKRCFAFILSYILLISSINLVAFSSECIDCSTSLKVAVLGADEIAQARVCDFIYRFCGKDNNKIEYTFKEFPYNLKFDEINLIDDIKHSKGKEKLENSDVVIVLFNGFNEDWKSITADSLRLVKRFNKHKYIIFTPIDSDDLVKENRDVLSDMSRIIANMEHTIIQYEFPECSTEQTVAFVPDGAKYIPVYISDSITCQYLDLIIERFNETNLFLNDCCTKKCIYCGAIACATAIIAGILVPVCLFCRNRDSSGSHSSSDITRNIAENYCTIM